MNDKVVVTIGGVEHSWTMDEAAEIIDRIEAAMTRVIFDTMTVVQDEEES